MAPVADFDMAGVVLDDGLAEAGGLLIVMSFGRAV
jgi:hypothetical protein